MAILTLTTDFGTTDFYVARLKGLIYSEINDIKIIDITHNIKNFDVQAAAFQVKHSWKSFPQHSVHVVWVGDQQSKKSYWIACKFEKHFFVVPNNGLISLIIAKQPEQVVQLNNENFPTDIFLAKIIAQIAREQSIISVGDHTSNYLERLVPLPVVSGNLIRGAVQHIDKYGNIITNIERNLIKANLTDINIKIVTRSHRFETIHTKYSDVIASEKVAFFNSQGLLQLSINQGSAASLLGFKIGNTIQVELLPRTAF